MATAEDKDVKDIVEEIVTLKRAIQTKGNDGRARLNAIPIDDTCKDIINNNEQFDSTGWGQIPNDEKIDRYPKLLQVRDSLHAVAQFDGPLDPNHIMYATYAAKKAIYACAALGGILLVALLCVIVLLWDKALNADYAEQINEAMTAVTTLIEAERAADKAAGEALIAQQTTDEHVRASAG